MNIEINKVYNMDCLIGMQYIPDKSIDMILCDLPYGTTACKWDVIIPFAPLWEQYERVIKDNGVIVLTASQPFTSALVMSNPKIFKYDLTWDKSLATGFLNANKMPLRRHEDICIFYKNPATYNPQFSYGIPYGKRSRKDTDIRQYGKFLGIDSENKDGKRFPTSIIDISNANRNKEGFHPTQKPVPLFEYLIKTYTNDGEMVLDNCMGSGTTAIACINTNRNYIGFELDEKYFNTIEERIKKHNKPSVFYEPILVEGEPSLFDDLIK